MERSTFAERLQSAANQSLLLSLTSTPPEPWPEAVGLRFRVRLNCSYDGWAGREVRLYPEDGSYEQAFRYRSCPLDEVVDLLWRDGRVPEWVDLHAIDLVGEDVVMEACCCGRFTADDSTLYHQEGGTAPFNPQGPGGAFGSAIQFECWDADDLGRLGAVADRVCSLVLATDAFDSGGLYALPEMPQLAEVRYTRCPGIGDPLEPWSRFPSLRRLSITFTGKSEPVFMGKTVLGALTHLTLDELPAGPWGSGALRQSVPALRHLSLAAADSLWLDGDLPAAPEYLSLWATRLLGQPHLQATLDFLAFHVTESGAPGATAALASLGTVRGADFQDTPLTEDEARSLPGRLGLEYLRIANCGVSQDVVNAIAQAHPETNILPRPSG
jgi:hypothetical protein